MLTNILSFLDAQRDLVIELQREMTSRPALCPTSGGEGEIAKAEYLKQWLLDAGVKDVSEIQAADDRVPCGYRPTIVAKIPGKSSKTLWVMGHTDVVPTGDVDLWDTDPWTLHVDGDYIYGRGVEDNQQAVTSMLLVAKALVEHNVTPELTFGILLVADEETGSNYGVDYLLHNHADMFAKDDLLLVPDIGDEHGTMIEIAEKSIFWHKVCVKGQQCHASTPEKGINSLEAASAFIVRIKELYTKFDLNDPLFDPPISTFTPTKKEANVPNINTVPGQDIFYIDCRVLPQYDIDDVRNAIHAIGDEIAAQYGVTISYEDVQAGASAPATPVDSEVVTKLARAITRVYEVTPKPMGVGGGTVASDLRRSGYNVACWSKLVPNAHVPNEKSRISCNIGDAKVIATMLLEEA